MGVHKDSRARLSLWLARGILILNLSLGLSYVGLWVLAAVQDLFWRADFSAFYTGWAIVRDGQGAHLYDPDVQMRYQQSILQGRSFEDGLLPYVNPPHLTLPFVPLAWLPRPTAYVVWALAQCALLAWLLYLLWGMAGDWERQERWLLLTAVIAFPPLLSNFMIGAFSLLLLVCFMQFYFALKNARQEWAGFWLVLGTLKPQVAVLPGLTLLAARRWRAIGSAVLWGGALAALSVAVLGWSSWQGYVRILQTHTGLFDRFNVSPSIMYNLKGTLTLILGNGQGALINQISYVALGVSAVVTLWLWRGPWPKSPSFELRLALTMMLSLLFSMHLNPQDGVMLIMPAVLFYVYLRQRNLPRRAYAAFVLACPLVFLVSEFTVGGSLGIRAPVVAMVILIVWMGWALWDDRQAA